MTQENEQALVIGGEEPQPYHGYIRPATRHNPENYRGLTPLEPFDSSKIFTFDQFLAAYERMPFANYEIGKAARLIERVAKEKNTFTVVALAGALTPGQLSLLVTDLVDYNIGQAFISTGALLTHGLTQGAGMKHYMVPPGMKDTTLYKHRINRIHRAAEPEDNLDDLEGIFTGILNHTDNRRVHSSSFFTQELGRYLHDNIPGRGMLKSAYEKGVPVFIPAFYDSELGLDLLLHNHERDERGLPPVQFNDGIDADIYAELIRENVARGKKIAMIVISGGTPRNWGQQVGPYLDLQGKRLHERHPEIPEPKPIMFDYGLKITLNTPKDGGLSGSTMEEAKSWGKYKPRAKLVEVQEDVFSVLPLIMMGVFERLNRQPVKKNVYAGPEAMAEIEAKVNRRYNRNLDATLYQAEASSL